MIQSEVQITTQKEVDKERVDYIKRIRLETSFYNLFRNTIRILINDYENIKIREKNLYVLHATIYILFLIFIFLFFIFYFLFF